LPFSQRLRRLVHANSTHLKAVSIAHYPPHRLDASRLATTFQPLLAPAQLVETLGNPQRKLSFYACESRDIPAGLAPPMAREFGVSVDELMGETEKKKRAGAGPTGRMRRPFEAASKSPRLEQERSRWCSKPSSISTPTAKRERERGELRPFSF
jgi:hypothetical protein